jgi:hypothetical protein
MNNLASFIKFAKLIYILIPFLIKLKRIHLINCSKIKLLNTLRTEILFACFGFANTYYDHTKSIKNKLY